MPGNWCLAVGDLIKATLAAVITLLLMLLLSSLLLESIHVLKDKHGIVLQEGVVGWKAGESSNRCGWWWRWWRQACWQGCLLLPGGVWPTVVVTRYIIEWSKRSYRPGHGRSIDWSSRQVCWRQRGGAHRVCQLGVDVQVRSPSRRRRRHAGVGTAPHQGHLVGRLFLIPIVLHHKKSGTCSAASVYLNLDSAYLRGVGGGHLVQLQLKYASSKFKYTSATPRCT